MSADGVVEQLEKAIDSTDLLGCGCCGGLYDYEKYESRSEALAAALAPLVVLRPSIEELADMLRETFSADPGGVTWQQGAESILILLGGAS